MEGQQDPQRLPDLSATLPFLSMKTTTIDGFSSAPALQEIAPESPGAANEFIGLNAAYVGGFVGVQCAAVIHQIDHEVLEHGRDWKMLYREQWFTPDGLSRIIEELHARGFSAEASALCLHIDSKRAALRRCFNNARRWDLNVEAMA